MADPATLSTSKPAADVQTTHGLAMSDVLPGVVDTNQSDPTSSSPASSGDKPPAPGASAEPAKAGAAPQPAGEPAKTDDGNAPAAADAATTGIATDAGGSQPAPAPKPKFKLGNLEFDSEEHAARQFSTLRGIHKSLEHKANAATLRALELENELRRSREQNTAPQPTSAAPAGAGQPQGDQPSGEPAGIDWSVFQVLQEKHGLGIAMQWLNDENTKLLGGAVTKAVEHALAQLDERIKPLQEAHQEQTDIIEQAQLLERLSTFRYSNGQLAYPELNNPSVLAEIRGIWDNLGFDPKELRTERGLHVAIATYRDAMRMRAGAVSNTPPPAAAAAAPAASPVVDGAGDRQAHNPNSQPKRISAADAILNAPLGFDAELGIRF